MEINSSQSDIEIFKQDSDINIYKQAIEEQNAKLFEPQNQRVIKQKNIQFQSKTPRAYLVDNQQRDHFQTNQFIDVPRPKTRPSSANIRNAKQKFQSQKKIRPQSAMAKSGNASTSQKVHNGQQNIKNQLFFKKSQYYDKERLFEENIKFKKQINWFKQEQVTFKTKITMLLKELAKQEDLIERLTRQNKEDQSAGNTQMRQNVYFERQLKIQVKEMRTKLKAKEDECEILKRNMKNTKFIELEKELKTIQEECLRLKQIAEENIRNAQLHQHNALNSQSRIEDNQQLYLQQSLISTLKKENQEIVTINKRAEEDALVLKKRIKELEKTNKLSRKHSIDANREEIHFTKKQSQEIQAQCEIYLKTIKELKTQLHTQKDQEEEQQKNIKQKDEQINELKNYIKFKEQDNSLQLKRKEEQLKQNQERLEQLMSVTKQENVFLKGFEMKLHELQSKLFLNNQYNRSSQSIILNDYKIKCQKIGDQMFQLQQEKIRLQKQNEELSAKLSKNVNENEEISQKLSWKKRSKDQNGSENASEIKDLQRTIQYLQSQNSQLAQSKEKEINQLKSEMVSFKHSLQYDNDFKKIEEELQQLKKDKQQLQDIIQKQFLQIQELQLKYKQTESQSRSQYNDKQNIFCDALQKQNSKELSKNEKHNQKQQKPQQVIISVKKQKTLQKSEEDNDQQQKSDNTTKKSQVASFKIVSNNQIEESLQKKRENEGSDIEESQEDQNKKYEFKKNQFKNNESSNNQEEEQEQESINVLIGSTKFTEENKVQISNFKDSKLEGKNVDLQKQKNEQSQYVTLQPYEQILIKLAKQINLTQKSAYHQQSIKFRCTKEYFAYKVKQFPKDLLQSLHLPNWNEYIYQKDIIFWGNQIQKEFQIFSINKQEVKSIFKLLQQIEKTVAVPVFFTYIDLYRAALNEDEEINPERYKRIKKFPFIYNIEPSKQVYLNLKQIVSQIDSSISIFQCLGFDLEGIQNVSTLSIDQFGKILQKFIQINPKDVQKLYKKCLVGDSEEILQHHFSAILETYREPEIILNAYLHSFSLEHSLLDIIEDHEFNFCFDFIKKQKPSSKLSDCYRKNEFIKFIKKIFCCSFQQVSIVFYHLQRNAKVQLKDFCTYADVVNENQNGDCDFLGLSRRFPLARNKNLIEAEIGSFDILQVFAKFFDQNGISTLQYYENHGLAADVILSKKQFISKLADQMKEIDQEEAEKLFNCLVNNKEFRIPAYHLMTCIDQLRINPVMEDDQDLPA